MDSERDPSISSLIVLCIREFHTLLDVIPHEKKETRLEVQDDLGRLRVWVGNFGAHRKQTDRLSLDHRLREAPDLHHEVRNHIYDISEAIQGVIPLFLESEKPPKVDGASTDSETDELDSDDPVSDGFWDQVKAENDEHSKVNEYMHDIQYTITSLYKFSLTLQNPAHRDRTARAARIDLSHFEFYDIQHVSDKYNLPRDSMLAKRLGKANTKRRQLLAYHKDHAEKISKYVDVAVKKAIEISKDPIRDNGLDMPNKGPRSISTKWTQDTTVSTIYHQDIDVASDSGQTKFSATTSTTGDQAHTLMPPPPPPAGMVNTVKYAVENTDQNTSFFCPYCRQTIQLENKDKDWNYHVYSDLQPYIFTFGNCVKANQLYDSYTEWSEHERQFHRREWICGMCSCTYQSEAFFRKHLEDAHAGVLPENQRQAIVKLSERCTSFAQQCPLCTKSPISDPSRFQQHLARHLQQLSLFVLPGPEPEENEHATRDGESNESRQVLIVDDEARKSFKSISTNKESSLMENGSTLSEGSSSVDQLEAIETENRRGFEEEIVKEHQEMKNNEKTLGKCPHPDCGRVCKDIQAHMLTHQLERPEKCPILTCEYHIKGFARKYDKNRHTLTHYRGTMVCGFCPGFGSPAEKSFNRADVFKRHLTSSHGVEQTPPNYRKRGPGAAAKKGTNYSPDATVKCSTCTSAFSNAQDFYEHLDDCVLRVVQQEEPSEAINQQRLAEVASDEEVKNTMQIHQPLDIAGSVDEFDDYEDHDEDDTHEDQGRREEAEKLQVQVMETLKAKLGADHPDTLTSMASLASTYWSQCRWEEAERLQVQVMETLKAKLGEDHIDTLTSMDSLASTYWSQGQREEAEKLQVQVMETLKTKLGADHPDTLTCMASLASTYWSQGRSEEAEKLQAQVIDTRKTKLGEDYPNTLISMGNLASTYWSQGRWEEAERIQVQMMETLKTTLGADHPDTLTSMASLASTYWSQGRSEEAEKLQAQVIETRKTKLGEDYPDTLTSMASQASTWKS
ncbi:hypothetical protein PENFLA_c026G04506 [Penicillium flavigenum]|uniref:C2H2-type domain-containing protein n=1 Tax=Penicillium flavigenum TaxID=254877 RepID=A0A1V6SSR7_9EURO|nr:hypothetical protein PENFLA_c026G04506 [Penicillium flavigenum]